MNTPKSLLWTTVMLICIFPASHPSSAATQNEMEREYTVGPGDVLQIKVWDHEDLNRTVEVSEQGSFTFPFIGKVKVNNMTSFQIEDVLEKRLADGYLVAPEVSITMAEYKNQRVFLFGEVKNPGVYMLTHHNNLLELISEAGGFTENRGSICTIVRPRTASKKNEPTLISEANENEIVVINIDHLISGTLKAAQPAVHPGDSIYIAEAEIVYVTGEVKTPGVIRWKKGITVREAVSQAGGGTARSAVKRTRIIRKVNGIEKEIRPGLSDILEPNDIVKVPESYF